MTYDFSDIFYNQSEVLLEDFMDKYTSCIGYTSDTGPIKTPLYYEKILQIMNAPFQEDTLLASFEELSKYKISCAIPYVIMSNEIYGLKSLLIAKMSRYSAHAKVVELLQIIDKINNRVALIYLKAYMKKLTSSNNMRISSIADLVEKNIITHYESHLIWLNKLTKLIEDSQKEGFVELDHNLCDFGLWLHEEGKKVIHNNSKYKAIEHLHQNLHLFAKKIYDYLDKGQEHVLLNYLEKCELISLSIGTELALIDNILMNKRITKDALTGALNRHALSSVFESQYELSLATNTPFILAMCDLDFFKDINDVYGHIAGDKVLESFVKTVKQVIRNSDIIIRYGGEEFIIMLPAISKDKGSSILEKVRQSFEESSLIFEGKTLKATVSIGMMEITPENRYKKEFLETYLSIVDRELYMAKSAGRNRIEMC
jgi:diguanylate cyclase (GGDEF)-like protein